jgi:glycosyltransferase involved in cell wall biosynthesis
MTKPTVCLNMIVKDEAHVIRRCLDSVRPLIDRWIVVDTGSTDGTQQVVRDCLADVPGELFERPWRGFGASRSEAITLARPHADYLLFIDADDVMEVPAGFVMPPLVEDAYEITIEYGQLVYRRVGLVRSSLSWRYEGVLHEYLECEGRFSLGKLEGVKMRIVGGGGRSQATEGEKFRRDAATLEEALRDDPNNTRYAFYLAQSHRDAGELEKALAAYDRRAGMAGFDQEIYCSMHNAAKLAARLTRPQGEIIDRYLRAFEFRPSRVESLGELMLYLRENGPRWRLAFLIGEQAIRIPPSGDTLFVEQAWYDWRCLDEFAIAAYWIGEFERSRHACERLLGGGLLPAAHHARVLANLNFARAKLGLDPVKA